MQPTSSLVQIKSVLVDGDVAIGKKTVVIIQMNGIAVSLLFPCHRFLVM